MPVSLTSVVGSLLEILIWYRIKCHLEKSGLIDACQHQFVKAKSYLTNLIEFFDVATDRIDELNAVSELSGNYSYLNLKSLQLFDLYPFSTASRTGS